MEARVDLLSTIQGAPGNIMSNTSDKIEPDSVAMSSDVGFGADEQTSKVSNSLDMEKIHDDQNSFSNDHACEDVQLTPVRVAQTLSESLFEVTNEKKPISNETFMHNPPIASINNVLDSRLLTPAHSTHESTSGVLDEKMATPTDITTTLEGRAIDRKALTIGINVSNREGLKSVAKPVKPRKEIEIGKSKKTLKNIKPSSKPAMMRAFATTRAKDGKINVNKSRDLDKRMDKLEKFHGKTMSRLPTGQSKTNTRSQSFSRSNEDIPSTKSLQDISQSKDNDHSLQSLKDISRLSDNTNAKVDLFRSKDNTDGIESLKNISESELIIRAAKFSRDIAWSNDIIMEPNSLSNVTGSPQNDITLQSAEETSQLSGNFVVQSGTMSSSNELDASQEVNSSSVADRMLDLKNNDEKHAISESDQLDNQSRNNSSRPRAAVEEQSKLPLLPRNNDVKVTSLLNETTKELILRKILLKISADIQSAGVVKNAMALRNKELKHQVAELNKQIALSNTASSNRHNGKLDVRVLSHSHNTSKIPTSVQASLNLQYQHKQRLELERSKYESLLVENKQLVGKIKQLESKVSNKSVSTSQQAHRSNEALFWKNKHRDLNRELQKTNELLNSTVRQFEKETKINRALESKIDSIRLHNVRIPPTPYDLKLIPEEVYETKERTRSATMPLDNKPFYDEKAVAALGRKGYTIRRAKSEHFNDMHSQILESGRMPTAFKNAELEFEDMDALISRLQREASSLVGNINATNADPEKLRRAKVQTYTGTILVAMNPFQKLSIYEHAVLKRYIGRKLTDEPPHIFAIAEAAFNNLKTAKTNQSVIISGESGAGKSESTKLILQFLTTATSADKESWVQQQILEANTVLESFGNAKTSRNNNSSRFGKFIQVNINKNFSIVGASIVNYLLEKSRVSNQATDERNYHVFYELVQGCNEEEREKYLIQDVESYEYLNQSGCIEIDGVDEKRNFESLKLALTVLKLPAADLAAIFRTVSAILWIGNIQFNSNLQSETVSVANPEVLDKISELLAIDPLKFKESLCFKRLIIRGELTMIPVKPNQSNDNRNSVAKALYDNLFQRIVDFINKSLITKEKVANFIGVLDIFGFEDFKVNSFEQLCINFTNEKLQQFFNQFIFKLEQEEYDKEQIKWEKIKFTDNQVCLDLIEAKPAGIISLLDEETRFPKGSDESWLVKLDQNFAKHAYYVKPKMAKGVFGIKHYAGEVLYTVAGFLEKNKDAVSDDLIDIVKNSKVPWIANTFTAKAETSSESSKSSGKNGKPAAGPSNVVSSKMTAATYFKNQLVALVTILGATSPHYVRCIKPNLEKEAFLFDEDMVLSQLRYSGMLDTIRIRKAGFTIRTPFEAFTKSFKCLIPMTHSSPGSSFKETAVAIVQSVKVSSEFWQSGKTKIFFKEEGIAVLHREANKILKVKILIVQKVMHGYMYRKRFLKMKKSILLLQPICKGFVYRKRYQTNVKRIIKIQSAIRRWFARDYFLHLKFEAEELRRVADTGKSIEAATIALDEATSNGDRRRKFKAGITDDKVQQVFEKSTAFANSTIGSKKAMKDLVDALPQSLDLLKPSQAAKSSAEENQVDHLFSFIGDFAPSLRKAQIDGADTLALMADNLFAEIDLLLDFKKVAIIKGNGKSTDSLFSGRNTNNASSMNLLADNLQSAGGSADLLKKTRKFNPLKNAHGANLQHEWSFLEYAEKYFYIPADRKAKSLEDQIKYSKLPLTAPLLAAAHTDFLSPIALDINKLVDPALKKLDNSESAIQQLIKLGLDNIDLRDEILVQICRQVTPPSKDVPKLWDSMVLQGWMLLQIVTASFRPSKNLTKYLQSFVSQAFDGHVANGASIITNAQGIDQNLRLSAFMTGSRKYPPSIAEIHAIKNGCPLTTLFYFEDGHTQTKEILVGTTAAIALKEVARHFELKDLSGWSVFEIQGKISKMIKPTEFIADVLAARDIKESVPDDFVLLSSLKPDLINSPRRSKLAPLATLFTFGRKRSVSSVNTVATPNTPPSPLLAAPMFSEEIRLTIKKRVFKNRNEEISDLAEASLLYAQAVHDVARGDLIVTLETAIILAALQVQITFGELDEMEAEFNISKNLEILLPASHISEDNSVAIINRTVKEYCKISELRIGKAKEQYLNLIRKNPFYGSSQFAAKNLGFWSYPENFAITISEDTIIFGHLKTREIFITKAIKQVIGYDMDGQDCLSITFEGVVGEEGKDVVEFRLASKQADEIYQLLRDYQPIESKLKDEKMYENPAIIAQDIKKARRNLLTRMLIRIPGMDHQNSSAIGESKKTKILGKSGSKSSLIDPINVKSAESPKRNMFTSKIKIASTLVRSLSSSGHGGEKTSSKINLTLEKESPVEPIGSTTELAVLPSLSTESSVEAEAPTTVAEATHNEDDAPKDAPKEMVKIEVTISSTEEKSDRPFASADSLSTNLDLTNWVFSKKALAQSLLNSNLESFDEWAIHVSETLLNFSPDLLLHIAEVQVIIAKCLLHSDYVNECYLQLIKFTSDHSDPDGKQYSNLWKLMSIWCNTVRPTGEVREYTKVYLKSRSMADHKSKHNRREETKYAEYCGSSLAELMNGKARTLPPSNVEIVASSLCLAIQIRVFLLDGQFRAANVASIMTVKALTLVLQDKLKIKSAFGYAIYARFGKSEEALEDEDIVADVLYKWQKIESMQTGQVRQKMKLFVKRRICLDPFEIPPNDNEANMLRIQAMDDVYRDKLPVGDEQAVYLTALLAQTVFGDYNSPSALAAKDYADTMATNTLPERHSSRPGIADAIRNRHKNLVGKSEESRSLYMDIIRSYKTYGSSIFEVEQTYSSSLPSSCWLAVGVKGISILPKFSQKALASHGYASILSFAPNSTGLLILTDKDDKYVFSTQQGLQIARLLQDYKIVLSQR